ncbi:MAG: DUF262 domain-containing protein [Fusobacteriaceae bacterium]
MTVENKNISHENKLKADLQIATLNKNVKYDTKDYTVELLVEKFTKKSFFIPEYQRADVWTSENKNFFIESLFLGLPIPFMFFATCSNGTFEIIDGAQRTRTISDFIGNKFKIEGLKKLTELNGFYYEDLLNARKDKFLNISLRIIILDENTTEDVRIDLFHRINTAGKNAVPSEVRRGAYRGKLTSFIELCSDNKDFIKLAPLSAKKVNQKDRFEFVLRFFAYLNNYENVGNEVKNFLDEYLKNNLNSFDEEKFKKEFESMLKFVEKHFPFGFAKSKDSSTTPRVRFEAISVGVALALREKINLYPTNIDWLDSHKFKELTTSDASNNKGKLEERVVYVKNQLLKG